MEVGETTSNQERKGCVGIFFMKSDLSGLLWHCARPVSEGCAYGDWIVCEDDHYHVWERLQKGRILRALDRDLQRDYALCPRGRVSFKCVADTFVVYHGNWLKPIHKAMINALFRLPFSMARYESDEHYDLS